MEDFLVLVKEYEELFRPLVPGVKCTIDRNLETLKNLLENDKKQEEIGGDRVPVTCPGRRNEFVISDIIDGATVLYQIFDLIISRYQNSIQGVSKMMESLSNATKSLYDIVDFLKSAVHENGYLFISEDVQKLMEICHESMDKLTNVVISVMDKIDRTCAVEHSQLQNTFSNCMPMCPTANIALGVNYLRFSDVDNLLERFEILYADVIECGFRLLLFKRFGTAADFSNLSLPLEIKLIENIVTQSRNEMQNFKMNSERFKKNTKSNGDVEPCTPDAHLVPINRFSREFQAYDQVRKLRSEVQEFDGFLAKMEEVGKCLVFPDQTDELVDLNKMRTELDKRFTSIITKCGRYSGLLKTLERNKEKIIDERLSESEGPNPIPNLEQIADEGEKELDLKDESVVYEADYNQSEDANLEDTHDELFYGRGHLGEGDSPEFSEKPLPETLDGLVFQGVMNELKNKLSERKQVMASRELSAVKIICDEVVISDGESDDYVIIESSDSLETPTTSGNRALDSTNQEDVAPNASFLDGEITRGTSFQHDLLQVIQSRPPIAMETFEIDEFHYENSEESFEITDG